jgi:hypothetical protein
MVICADDTKPVRSKKIAEAFHVSVTLDDIYFGAGLECAPGSIQPVIAASIQLHDESDLNGSS